jgi:hypothetical protein
MKRNILKFQIGNEEWYLIKIKKDASPKFIKSESIKYEEQLRTERIVLIQGIENDKPITLCRINPDIHIEDHKPLEEIRNWLIELDIDE